MIEAFRQAPEQKTGLRPDAFRRKELLQCLQAISLRKYGFFCNETHAAAARLKWIWQRGRQ